MEELEIDQETQDRIMVETAAEIVASIEAAKAEAFDADRQVMAAVLEHKGAMSEAENDSQRAMKERLADAEKYRRHALMAAEKERAMALKRLMREREKEEKNADQKHYSGLSGSELSFGEAIQVWKSAAMRDLVTARENWDRRRADAGTRHATVLKEIEMLRRIAIGDYENAVVLAQSEYRANMAGIESLKNDQVAVAVQDREDRISSAVSAANAARRSIAEMATKHTAEIERWVSERSEVARLALCDQVSNTLSEAGDSCRREGQRLYALWKEIPSHENPEGRIAEIMALRPVATESTAMDWVDEHVKEIIDEYHRRCQEIFAEVCNSLNVQNEKSRAMERSAHDAYDAAVAEAWALYEDAAGGFRRVQTDLVSAALEVMLNAMAGFAEKEYESTERLADELGAGMDQAFYGERIKINDSLRTVISEMDTQSVEDRLLKHRSREEEILAVFKDRKLKADEEFFAVQMISD